jgi:hypothetical protein
MRRGTLPTVTLLAAVATSALAAGPRGHAGGDRAVPRHPGASGPGGGYGRAHGAHPRPGYGSHHGYRHGYYPYYGYYAYHPYSYPYYAGWYGPPGWAFGLSLHSGDAYAPAYVFPPAVYAAGDEAGASAYAQVAAKARIQLVVTPEDASVWVDGQFRGVAHRIGHLSLAPGRHRVQFARPGFQPAARDVLADEGTADVLRLELESADATAVRTEPPNAATP